MAAPALIIHGGTGNIAAQDHPAYLSGLRDAAEAAWRLLNGGSTALEAVEAAVRNLEDDTTFNAGRGSVLNSKGEIEMDAAIMDGRTLDFGAVIAVRGIANPITLARLIMTQTPHKVLAGMGAREFASKMGIPFSSMLELTTPKTLKRYHERRAKAATRFATFTGGRLARLPWIGTATWLRPLRQVARPSKCLAGSGTRR